MNTTENNKLIAEFMTPKGYDGYGKAPNQVAPKFLKYHSSWDWLMPVVKKIGELECSREITIKFHDFPTYCFISGEKYFAVTHNVYPSFESYSEERENSGVWHRTLIEAVYKAIVEFIKWYNENKKT